MVRTAVPFCLAAVAVAGWAAALSAQQKVPIPKPEDVAQTVQHTVQAVDEQVKCLQGKQRALEEVLQLLREAEAQAAAAGPEDAARSEARAAVGALWQRAYVLHQEACSCKEILPDPPPFEGPGGDPALAALAEPNPATRQFERDVQLAPAVRVVVGEQVDGLGRIRGAVVRGAVHALGGQLNGCYGRTASRKWKGEQRLNLVFIVARDGRVSKVEVEGAAEANPRLRRCVRRAASSLRLAGRPDGGRVTISYTLSFSRPAKRQRGR